MSIVKTVEKTDVPLSRPRNRGPSLGDSPRLAAVLRVSPPVPPTSHGTPRIIAFQLSAFRFSFVPFRPMPADSLFPAPSIVPANLRCGYRRADNPFLTILSRRVITAFCGRNKRGRPEITFLPTVTTSRDNSLLTSFPDTSETSPRSSAILLFRRG